MGMFDYVEVDTNDIKGNFQTKSANNLMEQYKIKHNLLYIKANGKWYKHPWFTGELIFSTYDRKTLTLSNYIANFDEGVLTKAIEQLRVQQND